MTALLAFLATPAGQTLIATVVAAVAAAFHKKVSEDASAMIKDVAPIAVKAAEQLADKSTSNETKKQQAAEAVAAAIPFVAKLVVPGIKKQIDAHVEAAVHALPPTGKTIVSGISDALNGK